MDDRGARCPGEHSIDQRGRRSVNLIYYLRKATWHWRKRYGLVWRTQRLLESDLSAGETDLLLSSLSELRPRYYLELGVYLGGTFRRMLERRDSLGLATECFGVDIWDEIHDGSPNTHSSNLQPNRRKVDRALRKAGLDRFTLLAGTAADLTKLVPAEIELAFHDANHTYQAVRDDMRQMREVMKPGGRLLVHNASQDRVPDRDYVAADGGPYQAVHDEAATGQWELIEIRERMAVLRKPV
jgi:cephalosporin hydroxylase